ncbi:MAG: serine/threonine protein kinase [Neomegalonema sp.]|nr:serine/threonine protein kinase [Neomegalonema sp.]
MEEAPKTEVPGGPGLPSLPSRVGKYRIDGVIGAGAMGIVMRGHDEQIDRPVAVKTIRLDLVSDIDQKQLLERFGREARSAGRCLHPNIVTVFDYVEQGGAPFIIMEYVDAGTLEGVIRSGGLMPLRQVGEVGGQLLLALDHAHQKGVVHRDVKPSNILCPTPSSIKVTDFGVARLDSLGATAAAMTGVGAIGTPNYMSPEQFLGRSVDGRSDIFAAGVILYQLLTGTKPFLANTIFELKEMLLNHRPKPVSLFRPDAPAALDGVIDRALARNVDDRYQRAEAFAQDLARAIETLPVNGPPPLDLTEMAPQPSSEGGSSSMTMTLAETLDGSTMQSLEGALAESIGPIARVVLKKACASATDPQNLLDQLAERIPSAGEAKKFRDRMEASLRADPGLTSIQLDSAITERQENEAAQILMRYIGPVAKVIARKKAKTALGYDDFYTRLADAILDDGERQAFMREKPE